ncbi:PAS domain S-box protein [Novosphingobium sp. BL-52-GroH]|uniref:PAS domain-containing hybrid sensor histidine kinase/response regulator n=1 Tax=Novosphingobium sp. BL-52-GroH TaxID=3349877 RepID=UPI00384E7BE8
MNDDAERLAALEAEIAHKRAILESSLDFAIIATDRSGIVTDWNSGARHIFGWHAEEMWGQTAERIFTPEDVAVDRIDTEMKLALKDGRASDERWHLRKDGSRFWASGEMMPLRDEAGAHLGFIKIVRDRTAEHRAGHKLRQTEASLLRAQDVGGLGVFSITDDGMLRASAAFCRMFGVPESDILPTSEIDQLVLPEDREIASTVQTRADGTAARNVTYRICRADTGELRWIARTGEVEYDVDGNPVSFAGTVRDVTQDRIAIRKLEEKERQARAFADERRFITDLLVAQRAQTDPDEVMRLSAAELAKRLPASRIGFYRMAGGHQVNYGPSVTDGTLRPLAGLRATDEFGKRVEQQRRSGETLVFTDSRNDPVGGLERFADQGVLSGICLSIFSDRRWLGGFYLHHRAVRVWTQAEISLAREVAELTWLAVERVEAMIRMAGRIEHQDAALGRVATELQEETALRAEAETQLRQLQKMEAIGQLTGGIAHDFNNMLGVVIGGLNLATRRLARGETDISKYLDAALDGATRAASLTQRLLAFSRQQPLAPEPIDANRLVSGLSELLARTLGETIALETVLSAGLWKINADANQLENVLVNMAVNARDAMPGGGKVTIETHNAYVDAAYAREYELEIGQYVLICVTDTGTGMAPEVITKAFEPFYTTKPSGKGTGLGLSQVFGFVRQSGGHVKVYSELEHGTTFKIYLPRFFGEATIPVIRSGNGPLRRGDVTEVILVVEDEQRLRDFTVEALRELGYTVVHAENGTDALSLMEAGQAVSLLLTDIVMPGMTGRQLADHTLGLQPDLKVLFMTGYTRNAVVHNGVIDPGTNFLSKPFSVDNLGNIVRRVLES